MGNKTVREQPNSQATPLAQDVLAQLQGALSANGLGAGIGPLQREAGTALRQFVNSGGPQTAVSVDQELSDLFSSLTTLNERGTNRQAQDLRESMGAAGNRFSSSLSVGEGIMRADNRQNLDNTLSQLGFDALGLRQQGRQFDASQQLRGMESLFNMGTQAMNPFLQMAQLGILPEQISREPGLASQIIGTGLQIGGMLMPGGMPSIGGGIPATPAYIPPPPMRGV